MVRMISMGKFGNRLDNLVHLMAYHPFEGLFVVVVEKSYDIMIVFHAPFDIDGQTARENDLRNVSVRLFSSHVGNT